MSNSVIRDKDEFELKSLDFAFQATITEYQAIREATLSRDGYRNSLLNYLILIITGMLVVLDYITTSQAYFAFLIVSIFVSAIGILYIYNSKLNTYLLFYEHTVLRRQLEDIISKTAQQSNSHPRWKVLQWQEFYRNLTMKQNRFDGFMNLLSFGLTGLIPPLASLGSIAIFYFIRPATQLMRFEFILLVISVVFFAALVVLSIQTSVSSSKLWSEINKLKTKNSSQ